MTPDRSSLRLAGRVALITGASRGIGAAVARCFANEGADLVLPMRHPEAAAELLAAMPRTKARVRTVVGDLEDRTFFARLRSVVEDEFGRLDIMIGNAGLIGPIGPISTIDDDAWERALVLNLNANFHLLKTFDALLRRAEAARAVFVTSGVTRKPGRAHLASYTVTKCALEAMVKTYAGETAQTAIKVNLLNPGPTRTHMRAELLPSENPLSVKPPDAVGTAFLELVAADCPYSGEIFDVEVIGEPGHPPSESFSSDDDVACRLVLRR